MVSSVKGWQCVTATQGGSQRTGRKHTRILLKTLDFLMFPDGPQPTDSVCPETLLAPGAKSYG